MYYFLVTAHNLIGESTLSVATSILAATVPIEPTQPVIVHQTSSAITFSWYEPDNGGSNIDDY
jgi:hypothetical protein